MTTEKIQEAEELLADKATELFANYCPSASNGNWYANLKRIGDYDIGNGKKRDRTPYVYLQVVVSAEDYEALKSADTSFFKSLCADYYNHDITAADDGIHIVSFSMEL